MKKQVTEERTVCDHCGKEHAFDKCLACGKDTCYDCKKTQGVEYRHAIHFSGSGDGFYCHACDELAARKGDKVHAAYRRIASLIREAEGFYADFKKRGDQAEEALKRLLP